MVNSLISSLSILGVISCLIISSSDGVRQNTTQMTAIAIMPNKIADLVDLLPANAAQPFELLSVGHGRHPLLRDRHPLADDIFLPEHAKVSRDEDHLPLA